jgi:uncharacterized protein (DUF2336 family)
MTPVATDESLDMVELARSQDKRDRGVLMENMTDLFLSPEGRLTEAERTSMIAIIGKLIDEVEITIRAKLSERLAVMPGAPRELVLRLAADEPGVARPLLLKSDVLKDIDLVQLVKHRAQEHRLAIAMRAGIGAEVSDELIKTGDEDVIEALIRNKDAVLSRQAIDYLVEESRRVDRFQEPLLRRKELPAALAMRMFWWVSAALRRHILANFPLKPEDLDDAMEGAVYSGTSGTNLVETEAEKLASRMLERGDLTPNVIVQELRDGHVNAFIAGLARISGIDYLTARRIAFSLSREALAVVCKAGGFYRNDFASTYLLLRQLQHPGSVTRADVLEDLLAVYDRADPNRVRVVLRHWMRDAQYMAAIDSIPAPGSKAAPASAASGAGGP